MKNQNDIKHLSLYHFQACPYCALTRRAISDMGLDIEKKDIRRTHINRTELLKGGGKLQVPCLRIDKENGKTTWLYESRDIIRYLSNFESKNRKVA